MTKRILVIIPAYNEALAISKVIADLRQVPLPLDILIIDDGSTDQTSSVARTTGADVIDLPVNLGVGGAVQTGFQYAVANGYQIALQFDGDGQHVAEEIVRLVAPVLSGECDVVIGSRFLDIKSTSTTGLRRVGIRFFELVNLMITGQRITDPTSGFRAYSRRTLEYLAEQYPDDYPEPEVLIPLIRRKLSVKEIPVRMREREAGNSSITLPRAIYYMIKVFLAMLVQSSRR